MKEIKIFFDSYFLEKVLEEVKEYGVRKYMLIPKMFSDWGEKLKHFDNHLWPGTDSMIIIYEHGLILQHARHFIWAYVIMIQIKAKRGAI